MDYEFRAGSPVGVDEDENSIRVSGYAAVFNQETNIGDAFLERIEKGAFKSAIKRGDDVVFLINHDGLPMARTKSGTLRLSEDDHGLKIDAELDVNDPDVQRIVPKMKRGDLDKMSFAFFPVKQSWDDSGDMPVRSIQDVELGDVSIVTNPAYSGTEIGLRSLQKCRDEKTISTANLSRVRMKAKLLLTH